MKSDKQSTFSSAAEIELRNMLRKHDPAGPVALQDCVRLEMSVARRISNHPQLGYQVEAGDYFIIPPFLNGALSWPATLVTTISLGLLLGLFVSSMVETATPVYTITTAMAEPWR